MKAFTPTGRAHEPVALAERDVPVPAPDQALIRVAAYSVNRGETFKLEDPDGWLPGKDVAGTVVRAAADGTGPGEGERVVAHLPGGGWAEYAAAATADVVPLPGHVGFTEAAALPLAGLTALRLLRAAGSLTGRRVLLTGASGGVGHYLVELAAAAGAEITAVSATPERGRRLMELGAEAVVSDVAAANGTFDVVLESVGGRSLPAALARLARHGTLIWFGQASREPVTLDFFDFFAGPEGATIRHFHYADPADPHGPDLATLVGLVASGRLHPEIGRVADWADTARVLTDLRERRVVGNAVLTLGGNP
ncbi:zinc-binding dehydrogenase [Actinomadura kijaniata]|uniref:NADPH:quinone reductase-like Zn-dependent oxidoreductase n=1 Tax=Actinomadura namibiensis TaxID=182080 RepID=A0A7W3LTF3_ACTNM|nr:zinc-binding dehydrogenase [Actinomadura namibiensis]MBA8953986.1 NADPH:quinone reductase-like Zn-dependent oxidoreductase [Actinomadura namibiensis]